MSFFGLLFWIVVLWLVIRMWRRSGRCVTAGSGSYPPWDYGRGRYQAPGAERTYADTRQEYIESLESRLTDLEERLDFTERLLANRNQVSNQV
jgi:hypothetical protein